MATNAVPVFKRVLKRIIISYVTSANARKFGHENDFRADEGDEFQPLALTPDVVPYATKSIDAALQQYEARIKGIANIFERAETMARSFFCRLRSIS